jgi:mediator of RNA polymerase II transcription subunit 17
MYDFYFIVSKLRRSLFILINIILLFVCFIQQYLGKESMTDDIRNIDKIEDGIYSVPDVSYLNFNRNLMEGEHQNLPNPYYKQQITSAKQSNDYSHLTDNILNSIIKDYGPFNELTEEKLQKIIVEKNNTTQINIKEENLMDIDENETDLDRTHDTLNKSNDSQYELEFYKKRDQLLQLVRNALGSSTVTLDFVSLLLSSVRPAAGSSSMSPHLKQVIKLGSLSCQKIISNIPDQENHEREHNIESMKIGRGWKLQSLQKSNEIIKSSTEKMKKNLNDENTYWNEVLDVLKSNELITTVSVPVLLSKSSSNLQLRSKIPNTLRQKKVLAVKYGYGDSGSDYFDDGIAVLKKGENGHLEFEKLNHNEREKAWGGEKIVSVKIFKISKNLNEVPELIGQSDSFGTLKQELIENNNSFVSKVKNSRFFIFENELFWHLMKEAASLITLQIQIIDSIIKINLFDTCIQLESIDINSDELKNPTPELPENKRADEIIKFFKILLCANNYKNIQKLHVPPVALSKDNTTHRNKQSVLILPIVMYTKHNHMINKFKNMLFSLLLDTGLEEEKAKSVINDELIIKKYVNDPNELQQFKNSKRCYNNDPFLRVYSKMAPTSLIILKYNGLKIWIELVSSYSTLHISMNVKVIKSESKELLLESTFNSKRDIEQCLSWILKQDL